MAWYLPITQLDDADRKKGLKYLFYDGLCSHAMALLVTGAFLPGMALALGASNFVIGLLASLAPISQMAQIPAILLVEKIGLRKLLTVVFAGASRLSLVAAAFTPFFAPEGTGVFLFTLFMMLFFFGGSVAGCSWNSWIKDIVPEKTMGSYLASRLAAATALGATLSLAAGFSVDGLTNIYDDLARAYAVIFLIAAGFGLYGTGLLTHVPEPRMAAREADRHWLSTLIEPVQDHNFRKLLFFSAAWSFTVIMSGAFFAVYMLKRIGIPMSGVILLALLSQVTNVYFFKVWGRIADHFSNKSVLAVSVPLYVLLLLTYPFTTLPERYSLTIPLLIFIHLVGGISTAGFNLCAANIALKLAPRGKATAYLGTNAFCAGLAATIAPVIGGLIGSFFAIKEISINIFYRKDIAEMADAVAIPALSLRGIDFVFCASAMMGLYAWHRLSLIEEAGTVSESEVRDQVFASVRNSFFTPSGLNMGMRRMTAFPYEILRKTTRSTSSTINRMTRRGPD
ncbi:MFS transporter [Coraliomargarita sinensis]|uniref:MFS transporter n=1 Tax=Coraliomargarita sinensis TaxID=2174842 RepID=A0A317ZE04_9BACT|nr:MFS transporter [Coraliomargarita sinensis]PXA03595.1 MFS transporter [Coraliomargarita sinensis]